jgi:hypothetical protein
MVITKFLASRFAHPSVHVKRLLRHYETQLQMLSGCPAREDWFRCVKSLKCSAVVHRLDIYVS